MPYSRHLYPEHRLAVLRMSGRIGPDELIRSVETVFEDPFWQRGFGLAWDLRAIDGLGFAPSDDEGVGEKMAAALPDVGGGRSALIARGGTADMMEQLLEVRRYGTPDRELRVFRRYAEAAEWLGVPVEVLTQRWGAGRGGEDR